MRPRKKPMKNGLPTSERLFKGVIPSPRHPRDGRFLPH
ncbi:Uncharacterised protein [Vibrio cholerae]|nr:Uncharacterised protein [Vibrio cholerae]